MISRGIKVGNVEALQQQRAILVNQQLMQNLTKLLGLGAGAGLLARGAQGAYNLGRRALSSPHTLKPTTIAVPVHEEEGKVASSLADFAAGSAASDWTGHPMALPGVAAAVGGGALGGWKLMDYVLDRRRKQLMKNELEATKRQYEQALLAQYDKRASALGQDLDQLFDLLQEKQAGGWDTLGQAAGLATLGAGGIALLSGAITHNIGGKRRRQALLQKALRKRRREQAQSAPTRIFAVPQPLPATGSLNTAPTEDDLNGNPLDKTAARGLLATAQNVLRQSQPVTGTL